LELTREGDGGHSILGGRGIAVGKVRVRWVCTIVNGAGVPWFKCALHKYACWITGVKTHTKINICATCGKTLMTVGAWHIAGIFCKGFAKGR